MVTVQEEDAAVWFRVSGGGQNEAMQIPDVMAHCRERRYNVRREYTVHAKSAFKGDHQDDLDKMLRDLRDGVFTVLVIWHSDRIERRPGKALLDVLEEISRAGGRVESVQEPMLGQLDFGGQVTTFVQGLVNSEKSRLISVRVGETHDTIRQNGGLVGVHMWGFDLVPGPRSDFRGKLDKHLQPNAEGRKLAPGIFQKRADGMSLRAIADWLETETGRPWWPRTVASIIRNPAYRGVYYYTRDGVAYQHAIPDPPVGAALWRRANDALDAARTRPPLKPDRENTAMLSSLLRCANPACDATESSPENPSPMYRHQSNNKLKDGTVRANTYYRCGGRGRHRRGCGLMVPAGLVDQFVNDEMSRWDQPVTRREFVPGTNHDDEIEAVAYELKALPSLDLPEDEEDQRRAELRAEKKRLQGLPSVPDRWVEVETGETYGQVWARSTAAERRAFLKANADRFWFRAGRRDDGDFVIGLAWPE